MPQLTAAEIYAHPEFGKVPWQGKPTKEGFVDVAKGRGGPISIAYEIHGTGPNKLVVSKEAHHIRRDDLSPIISLFSSSHSVFFPFGR
jgi:hypothetical protein